VLAVERARAVLVPDVDGRPPGQQIPWEQTPNHQRSNLNFEPASPTSAFKLPADLMGRTCER
jgi:hypothetical protein